MGSEQSPALPQVPQDSQTCTLLYPELLSASPEEFLHPELVVALQGPGATKNKKIQKDTQTNDFPNPGKR